MANDSSLSYNLGLAKLPETQDQRLFAELFRLYNAIKIVAEKSDIAAGTFPQISEELTFYGSSNKLSGITFFEDVSESLFVELFVDAGELKAKKSAAATNSFVGFNSTPGGALAGDKGEVTLSGIYLYGGGSLTPATPYYLAANGTLALSGTVLVGRAVTPHLLYFPGILN